MSSNSAITHQSRVEGIRPRIEWKEQAFAPSGACPAPHTGKRYEKGATPSAGRCFFRRAPGRGRWHRREQRRGKSTLLKILSRITPPTRGHIDMLGTVGSLLEIGTGFHPELTGLENVYLNGAILGMSTARSSVGWRRSSPSQKSTISGHAGQALQQRNACAAGLCSRRTPGSRDPDRRRGSVGRRSSISGEVPGANEVGRRHPRANCPVRKSSVGHGGASLSKSSAHCRRSACIRRSDARDNGSISP